MAVQKCFAEILLLFLVKKKNKRINIIKTKKTIKKKVQISLKNIKMDELFVSSYL